VPDQHKEKAPHDPSLRVRCNTYCFADYTESSIELLVRAVTVNLRTVAVAAAMRELDRSDWDYPGHADQWVEPVTFTWVRLSALS